MHPSCDFRPELLLKERFVLEDNAEQAKWLRCKGEGLWLCKVLITCLPTVQ